MTHWLGALATIEQVIGRIETPTRHMIEAAADLIPSPIISLNSVMTRDAQGATTRALFAGDIRESLRRAAQISQQVHVKYAGRRYRRVVALLDPHYDELWVGGKASYKLGAIIEPGGELIIYAPHLTHISITHGRLIEKYGYAPLEEVREMVEGSDELRANLAVAAHLAHVAYAGRTTADGLIAPRYRITLASGVSEEITRRVRRNLDHRTFDVARYRIRSRHNRSSRTPAATCTSSIRKCSDGRCSIRLRRDLPTPHPDRPHGHARQTGGSGERKAELFREVVGVGDRAVLRRAARLGPIELDNRPSLEVILAKRGHTRFHVHASVAELDEFVALGVGCRLDVFQVDDLDPVAIPPNRATGSPPPC